MSMSMAQSSEKELGVFDDGSTSDDGLSVDYSPPIDDSMLSDVTPDSTPPNDSEADQL